MYRTIMLILAYFLLVNLQKSVTINRRRTDKIKSTKGQKTKHTHKTRDRADISFRYMLCGKVTLHILTYHIQYKK